MSKSILKGASHRTSTGQRSQDRGIAGQSSTSGSESDQQSAQGSQDETNSMRLHHVHFATDPSIHLTHSTADYDRTPMKVVKNPCALPARGCPGLTYIPMDLPGGGQHGVREQESGPNSDSAGESSEEERAEGRSSKGNGRMRPCQRYALKVSAQKRRQKLSSVEVDAGFRSLSASAFSTLVTSPHDCLGGF